MLAALLASTAPVALAGAPALRQIAIPVPPVVTGLPYPHSCHAVGKLPDPVCTPGSVNPAVTQATIGSTICIHGWTATVRPSAANTGVVKRAAMRAYGLAVSQIGIVEFDHLIPLENGGSDDVTNLWPEISDLPGHGVNNRKDILENLAKAGICSGKVSLDAARVAIATDWTTAQAKLGL
jgi:hypothetical protein